MDGMQQLDTVSLSTPFGMPSSPIVKGKLANQEMLFLARHGQHHQLLPHEVNYRANIFALKSLGATQIIGISAVGSLHENISPGDFAIPDQYFDWTKGRRVSSFFGEGIAAHVSTATPVSARLVQWISQHARQMDIQIHTDVTYACVEGPRLGTRAESHFLRQVGCHVLGMTNVPEVFLAREAQICYATIGIATDYDCWMDDPSQHVKATEIFSLYRKSVQKAQILLSSLLSTPRPLEEPEIRQALNQALLTPEHAFTSEQRSWLDVLRR